MSGFYSGTPGIPATDDSGFNPNSRPRVDFGAADGSALALGHLRAWEGGAGYWIGVSTNLDDWTPALEDGLRLKSVDDLGNGYERVTYEMSDFGPPHLFFSVIPLFP